MKYISILAVLILLTGCSTVIKEAATTDITITSDSDRCSATYKSPKDVIGARVTWERTYSGCVFNINSDSSTPNEVVIEAIKDNNRLILEFLGDTAEMAAPMVNPGAVLKSTGENDNGFSESTVVTDEVE
jgi:uncharacterized protein YceK